MIAAGLFDNSAALTAAVLFAGITYATGQFLAGRRKGVTEALETALNEVRAITIRADRLEDEMHRMATEMAEVKQENVILRGLVTGGQPAVDAIDRAKAELTKITELEHEKTRRAIEAIRENALRSRQNLSAYQQSTGEDAPKMRRKETE
jgi:nanoRNase/pAp phosphatase (c-di-AMP/oligoRNAs hydrolase)